MLRLALAQLDLTVGALAENRKRIADACADAARAGAELVLAPELGDLGLPARGSAAAARVPARLPGRGRACSPREVEVPLVVGCPWLDGDRVRNAALVLANGAILARYDKRELPNYGVFDEERTFSPGRGSLHVETPGGALALTICEDVWLPDAVAEAAALGASLRAQHLGLAVPPRQGPGARGDARDARARRPLRRRLLQSRRRPGRARLRRPQRRLRARRDGARARRLVRRGAAGLRSRPRRLGARAAARLAAAPRAPPPRAPAGDDRAAARRRPRALSSPSVARAAGRRRPPSCGARCASGSATTCARTASSACCSGSRAASTRRSSPRWPPTRSAPTSVEAVSMPTRYNSEGTRSDARLVAERLGIAFREIADRGSAAGLRGRAARARAGWRPRTCRRASAACC